MLCAPEVHVIPVRIGSRRRVVEERADLERIDAWRTRHLEFSCTPDLRSVRVSGVFRIGDADGFLYFLREVLGVEAHESANEVVLIRTEL